MASRFNPISISLSPNVQKDDMALALKLIFRPWKWKNGSKIREFEEEFKKYLGVKHAFSFNSGRSALFAILKSLNLPEKSNILLQAFTCNAVVNPILWAEFNPIYIDCGDDFNIDIEKLSIRLASLAQDTTKTKVLVVQHTFGLPANVEEIVSIVRQNGGTVIEDCAHALGATISDNTLIQDFGTPKKVGTFGDTAFFSFSRDKVISSVYGGMATTNDDKIGKRLQKLQKEFGKPGHFWIFQQILHPILLYFIILPLYNFLDLGKLFLIFSQWLHILSKAVSWKEKRGLKPDYFPKALPNALVLMAQNQFNKLEIFNTHRKLIAEFYYEHLKNTKFGLPEMNGAASAKAMAGRSNMFLRFTVTHPKAHEIIYEAWHKENILLGDWYTSVIAPDDTKLNEMKYKTGACPNAEKLSKITLNLPTHINISIEDAKRITNLLNKWK